jgi:hypothetical protein
MKKRDVLISIIAVSFVPALSNTIPMEIPAAVVLCAVDPNSKPVLSGYYTPYVNDVEPNAPGYTLPINSEDIVNFEALSDLSAPANAISLIEQNGFAVIEHGFGLPDSNCEDIVKPYEYLKNRDIPLFVTADTLLHLYHIQFDETLKDIEEREFCADINDLTSALLADAFAGYEIYSGDLKEAAKRNIAYLSAAQKLIDPNYLVPELVSDIVTGELSKIEAHEGFFPSDIFLYNEDYSQYVPRGHYTRSEQLKRYFKTLMWYGRISFLLKGSDNFGQISLNDALISVYDAKIQTMQAVMLANAIDTVQVGQRTGRDIWERLYSVTAFYVGLADDLTPYEYLEAADKIFGIDFVPADLEDPNKFLELKVELALMRSPEIYGGTGEIIIYPPYTEESLNEVLEKTKGMRFMGQRFIPDSYMFQNLVFPQVTDYIGNFEHIPFTCCGGFRDYPRALDVMALLGSSEAQQILIEEGDTDYINYWTQFDKLQDEFEIMDVNDWNRNLYWGWLYTLKSLITEFGDGYPSFMRTQAWNKKELNAALASWTQLRHDTILYAKQSYTPGRGGGVREPPPGYVEPVPEFYGRLLALTQMTRQGLNGMNALSNEALIRIENLEGILTRLLEITNKELANQSLSEEDDAYIAGFADTLEAAVLGVDEQGTKTTLIADVHTNINEGKVLEEGVGYVDLIITAFATPDGSIFLAAGPVLSYYEFKQPMDERLTDEAWRDMLVSPYKLERCVWYQQIMP